MKIIVTSETTDNFKTVSDITWPVVQEYCDRHGYEFRPKIVVDSERGSIWERVRSLQDALKDCDWAVHVDADVLITNFHVPLTEFVDNDKSIVISSWLRIVQCLNIFWMWHGTNTTYRKRGFSAFKMPYGECNMFLKFQFFPRNASIASCGINTGSLITCKALGREVIIYCTFQE